MSDRGRVYFDNAATSFPKPPGVIEAVNEYMTRVGASAGRGAYREAVASGEMLARLRAALRRLLGAAAADHVLFAFNGTDALNLALKSVVKPGQHVVTSVLDHNSVLRPLTALHETRQVAWNAVPLEPGAGFVNVGAIREALTSKTALVVLTAASNVTGALQPIAEVAELCRARGILFLVDAAQAAGHAQLDFSGLGADLLATPGHKGLLGPQGTGLLLVRAGVEERMATVREGGTGSGSEHPIQPSWLPDRFEAGCHNGPGLAGLLAAVEWLERESVRAIELRERELTARLLDGLAGTPGLRVLGPADAGSRVGVVSVSCEDLPPQELALLLEQEFGLLVRSGLHCAPLAHRALGTERDGGATRISLGPFVTQADIDRLVEALRSITRSAQPG